MHSSATPDVSGRRVDRLSMARVLDLRGHKQQIIDTSVQDGLDPMDQNMPRFESAWLPRHSSANRHLHTNVTHRGGYGATGGRRG